MSGLTIVPHLWSIDNPHFYRANFFWQEPRFEKSWLTTLDMHIAGGSAKHGFNQQGKKVPLLNIYGLQNMQTLGNTPGLDPANRLDKILLDLAALPENGLFGKLKFTGKFHTIELILNFYQNFTKGFFLQLYLPIRHLKIDRTQFFVDCSPEDITTFPNKNIPEWRNFLSNFDAILSRFGLSKNNINQNGVGDLSLLGGWACNYEQTTKLDFIDVNAKIGVLAPTGIKRGLSNPFDLPTGYNGYWAIPLKFDFSLGYWEWLTWGLHIGSLFFIDQSRTLRMQTTTQESSFFMLLEGKAKVDPGTIWEVSSYIKADHIFRGLSLLFGYCYTQKERDLLCPEDKALFPLALVNASPLHKGWDMHVLHFLAEWDFTTSAYGVGWRTGFFYNYVFKGNHIFNTAIKDVYAGIDIAYAF